MESLHFPPVRFLACVHVILLLLISGATARGGRPSPPSRVLPQPGAASTKWTLPGGTVLLLRAGC